MIKVKNLHKHFGDLEVLNGIDEHISQGEVVVVIGPSGSGKSTFLRCLNLLEDVTEGEIYVDDELINTPKVNINIVRQKMGMVFQQFNLFPHLTIMDNITLAPVLLKKMTKEEAVKKGQELLERVNLAEKADAYPAQLSGGQKQRVAIARALAANPKILLCDEATSALDPQTTQSILHLLKQINRDYGITIVIITHEMSVVREICSHVAIIGNGHLVEQGRVSDIFTHPKTKEAKELIVKGRGEERRTLESHQKDLMKGKCCVRIVFSVNSSFEPVIANMVLRFGQPINILRADTKNVEGIARGEMILSLPDDVQMQEDMKTYLTERGLAVEEVDGYGMD